MSELAIVRQATTTLSIISGEQVKRADDLVLKDGRKILVVKGGNIQHLVNAIFNEFSKRLDRAGNRFQISRKWRWLSETDPYGAASRLSGPSMEAFLSEWFVFCEQVHSPAPRTHNSPPYQPNESYLKILDRLPPYVIATISQSRFLTKQLVSLFQVIE
jgi:hypothetical protein